MAVAVNRKERRTPRRAATRAAPRPAGVDSRATVWRGGAIVLAVVLAYANTLAGPFMLDDELSIVGNQTIRALWNLRALVFPPREFPIAGRPLVNISFALNYAFGALQPAGYHAVNIAVHAACALLL